MINFKINLYSPSGILVKKKNIKKDFNPFSSEIFFIDNIFSHTKLKSKCFVGVSCEDDEVFRRMVVGNLHKKLNHLEVTHSFSWQTSLDYCPKNKNGYESFSDL